MIHVLSLSNSHNNVVSIQKNRGDKSHSVIVALVVFARVVSGALKNGVIDEEEFNMLQALHLETQNELTGIDRRIEAEHMSLVKKSLLEEKNEPKKNQGTRV